MTPPASTEPMHCRSGCINMVKARSQAILPHCKVCGATVTTIFDEMILKIGCNSFDTRARGPVQQAREYNPCKNCEFWKGCDLGCVHPTESGPNCKQWLDERDAALIAQEREKWERERAKAPAEELVRAFTKGHVAGAAQAREDVLKKAQHIADTIPDFNRMDFMMMLRESLRSEVGK